MASSSDKLRDDGWRQLWRFLGGEHEHDEAGADAYERIRQKLLRFFRWRGCLSAEEHTDATFDRVARTLAEGKAVREQAPEKYVLGVARMVFLERQRQEIRQKKAEQQACDHSDPYPEDAADQQERLRALEQCMQSWSAPDRELLLSYHQSRGGARIIERQALAEKHGIPLNTLRIRMYRSRKKLEDCVRRKIS